MSAEWTAIIEAYKAAGQAHVFKYWDDLSPQEKADLIDDLKVIGVDSIAELVKVITDDAAKGDVKKDDAKKDVIAPFDSLMDASIAKPAEREAWRAAGIELIAKGHTAALTMAGGMGTRLGSSDPKGLFDAGLPSGKSIFQLQAERIARMTELAKRTGLGDGSICWYIMTSNATHTKTKDFLEKNKFFGLDPKNVFLFMQAEIPCLTKDGKLMLETRSRLAKSPNGNGGIYRALQTTGALKDMKTRGVTHVFIHSVDNILIQMVEPEFMGYCAVNKIDFGNKVLEKTDPKESVGVMALVNGKPSVIEYSDLPTALAEQRDPSGALAYRAASVAIHCVTVEFLERSIEASIPYHIAHKKIPVVSDDGKETVKPAKNNGIKLELFIFDALIYSLRPSAFFVPREGNFSPIKNASAPGVVDSPETARLDLSSYHVKLVKLAGGSVTQDDPKKDFFEISTSLSAGEFDLTDLKAKVGGKTLKAPLYLS